MKGFLTLAAKNIFRKGMRSMLTIAGIAIGVASVILVGIIGDIGTKAVNSELDSLGLNGISVSTDSASGFALTAEDLPVIRSVSHVIDAMPILTQNGTASINAEKGKTMVWGIDSGADQVISVELLHGRAISDGDVSGYADVCLIDESLAKTLYGRENIVGKRIHLTLGGVSDEYTVVGITKAGSGILQSLMGDYIPSFVYLPYTTMQSLTGTTKIQQIAVKIEDSSLVDDVSDDIVSLVERTRGVDGAVKTDNLAKQRDRLGNLLKIVTTALSAVGGISLLVAGLGIMTMMLVSVNERTREIGVKKAIGARRGDILMEFILEALTISVIGSIIGIGIGVGVAYAAGNAFSMTVIPAVDSILTAFVLSVFIGVLFGAYPAYKAASLRPVEALHRE